MMVREPNLKQGNSLPNHFAAQYHISMPLILHWSEMNHNLFYQLKQIKKNMIILQYLKKLPQH